MVAHACALLPVIIIETLVVRRKIRMPLGQAIGGVAAANIPSNDTADFLNNHRFASVRIVVGARESEHILAKFMKDSVVRGYLLQLLYERRSEGSIPFGHAEQAVPPPGGISRRDWLRAVAQLSEYRLID